MVLGCDTVLLTQTALEHTLNWQEEPTGQIQQLSNDDDKTANEDHGWQWAYIIAHAVNSIFSKLEVQAEDGKSKLHVKTHTIA